MKKIVLLLSIVGLYSCSDNSNPRKSSAGAQQEPVQQKQDSNATQNQAQQTKPETQTTKQDAPVENTCKLPEKFEAIFDVVYLASKTVLKDADDEVKAALEILKHVNDNLSKLKTVMTYQQLAQEISQVAKSKLTNLSAEQQATIDVGIATALKVINEKCSSQTNEFSISDVVTFAKDIIKSLPASTQSKFGDFDLAYIELLVKGLDLVE